MNFDALATSVTATLASPPRLMCQLTRVYQKGIQWASDPALVYQNFPEVDVHELLWSLVQVGEGSPRTNVARKLAHGSSWPAKLC
jgi:hypothetical protein